MNPKEPFNYILRGNVRDELNDSKGAIIDYTRAIELNPNYGLAYYHRSQSNEKLGLKKE